MCACVCMCVCVCVCVWNTQVSAVGPFHPKQKHQTTSYHATVLFNFLLISSFTCMNSIHSRTYPLAHMLTMNGCDIDVRIVFSLLTCSTCLSRITSDMVIILRAKNCLVGMSRASTTLPNVPVPECVCVCVCVCMYKLE